MIGIVCWPYLPISLHLMPNNDISIPIAQWSHKHYNTIAKHMTRSVMILSYTNCDASYIKPYDTLLSLIMINHVATVLWFNKLCIFNLHTISIYLSSSVLCWQQPQTVLVYFILWFHHFSYSSCSLWVFCSLRSYKQ